MEEPDLAVLRARYDEQLRAYVPARLPDGARVERDGPLVRVIGLDQRGFVTYRDLGGLDGAELDALIARQRDFYAARGEGVEWKLHGHDLPADLPRRLRAAGFEPEEQETVVIGPARPLAAAPAEPPAGVALREVSQRADLDRIAAMLSTVDGADRSFLAGALERELAADPTGTVVVVAEAGGGPAGGPTGEVVCAGWIRFVEGTQFATLWGGGTLPGWRRRGIYTALVRYRARLAVRLGYSYLQVDASDESRPILQRNGLFAVTTTTPYVHPAPSAGAGVKPAPRQDA